MESETLVGNYGYYITLQFLDAGTVPWDNSSHTRGSNYSLSHPSCLSPYPLSSSLSLQWSRMLEDELKGIGFRTFYIIWNMMKSIFIIKQKMSWEGRGRIERTKKGTRREGKLGSMLGSCHLKWPEILRTIPYPLWKSSHWKFIKWKCFLLSSISPAVVTISDVQYRSIIE